jgi:serine/threonine protein kinase
LVGPVRHPPVRILAVATKSRDRPCAACSAREVALKVLLPGLAAFLGVERFLKEIQIAAGLTHPHILALHDSGEAAGFLYYVMPYIYYVMPYIEGGSLRQRLAGGRRLTTGAPSM